MGCIEADQVVAQDEHCAFGKVIQPRKRLWKVRTAVNKRLAGIAAHCGEAVNPPAFAADFQVDRDTTRRERCFVRTRGRVAYLAVYLAPPNPLMSARLAGAAPRRAEGIAQRTGSDTTLAVRVSARRSS